MTSAPKRILFLAAPLATLAIYLVLLPAQRRALPSADDRPWLPLPATGMDASAPALRELLTFHPGGGPDLAATCGMRDDAPKHDIYRLRISRGAWEDFREITFVSRGEWLEIEVRDGFPPAPPEPSREGSGAREYAVVFPIAHARIHRRDAEPIRLAWDTQGLWHAEQKPLGCNDGRPITLEACIDGRYAIRHRNCDADAYPPTQRLWEAVTLLLPKPERAYWRAR